MEADGPFRRPAENVMTQARLVVGRVMKLRLMSYLGIC